jgi:addiction module RelE/StbE family toxin
MNPVRYTHIFSNREFIRQYKRVNVRIKKFVDRKLQIFRKNPLEHGLNNHPLRDAWTGYRSIDITADYRAIYREVREGKELNAYFVALGTHTELYG